VRDIEYTWAVLTLSCAGNDSCDAMPQQLNSPPCQHRQALLLPWHLSGTLSEFQRKGLAAHLGRCYRCRCELEALARLRWHLRERYQAEPGPSRELERRVMDIVNQAGGRSR
jgi:hypothetical protein